MKYVYAPVCALMAYKPELADKLKTMVEAIYGPMDTLLTCCFNDPMLEPGSCIVTPCVTCAERYIKNHPDCSSLLILELLAESNDFDFPDYGGMSMSIQDTCSAKTQPQVLQAVRRLLQRMNINLQEPQKSGAHSKCCGQLLYGKAPLEKVENYMKGRASEMPCEDVVVYCSSCIMSMGVGGRRPRYLLDLLYGETTDMKQMGVNEWNQKLADFRKKH